MTIRVQDGFDNVESGGASPPWTDQDHLWTCSPRLDKVKIYLNFAKY